MHDIWTENRGPLVPVVGRWRSRRALAAALVMLAATSVSVASGAGEAEAAPPSNDNFANAYALLPDLPRTAYGTNVDATRESSEPAQHAANRGGASVWFTWRPTQSGSVSIATTDSTFDTLLAVYVGSFGALTNVASNDDIFESFTAPRPSQSRVWFNATAGTTYYIAVDGYRSANGVSTGAVTMSLEWVAPLLPVASDRFADALPFSVASGSERLVSNNISATVAPEPDEPYAGSFLAQRSVWFTFVAPATGTLSANTATSGIDTILDVFRGTSLAGLTGVTNGFNDDEPTTQTSRVDGVPVISGQRYYLRVAAYQGVQGVVNLEVGFVASGVSTPPTAPTIKSVEGGDGEVTVAWDPPGSAGSGTITSYRVTASPGGATCTWTSGSLRCAVRGLVNGTQYTFSVVAISSAGTGAASVASEVVVPGASGGLVPLVPARILDTRLSSGRLDSGASLDLGVLGEGGVPTSGVSAVVLNVTVTEPSNPGYVTVFPTGSALPNASNLNFAPGQTVPNAVVAKVGTGGKVTLYNFGGSAHLIVDVVGWIPANKGIIPMTPARLMDTRPGNKTIDTQNAGFGAVRNGATEVLAIAGRAGIPPNGTDAVVLNVTVVDPTSPGYVTVFPTGETTPNASNVNFVAGQTVPNLVIAKLGKDGQVSIYNYGGSSHLVVDVVGYVPAGSGYAPISPSRLLDTRPSNNMTIDGTFRGSGTVGDGRTLNLTVVGRAGIPASGVGAVVLNVTATETTQPGFITAFPAGATRPTASSLNFTGGQTVANLVVAKVGSNGQISLYNFGGTTHMVVDVVGWYSL